MLQAVDIVKSISDNGRSSTKLEPLIVKSSCKEREGEERFKLSMNAKENKHEE